MKAGQLLSDLSYKLLLVKQFKMALEAARTCLKADDKNEYLYTNLPLCYLFNDQYTNAEKIYKEWKDKPWTATPEFKTYREEFLDDINTLEKKGVTHPDFAKIKELLKK